MHGYAYHGAYRQLEDYPLKLTQGDIRANVVHLMEDDADSSLVDPFTMQFQEALQCGWSVSSLVRTLELITDGCCCTTLVEQGHGLGAASIATAELAASLNLQCRSVVRPSMPRSFYAYN